MALTEPISRRLTDMFLVLSMLYLAEKARVLTVYSLPPTPPGLELLPKDVLSLPLLNFISQKVQTWPACKKKILTVRKQELLGVNTSFLTSFPVLRFL